MQGTTEYDPEAEQAEEQKIKMQKLAVLAALEEKVVESAQQSSSYFEPLIKTIVDNIQVKIENIHIRYEDAETIVVPPAANKGPFLYRNHSR